MRNIKGPSIGSTNRCNSGSYRNSKKNQDINSQNREYQKSDDFDEIRVDLDVYKVSPYTPAELPPLDSRDSKAKLDPNLVLDYSAATSQGVEAPKRGKTYSRVTGHRMAHSTGGGHDS